ncbi:DNA mismatch repair protein MutS [bacterium]|nr:DNA mismatch repair protein MutS [bacterium]
MKSGTPTHDQDNQAREQGGKKITPMMEQYRAIKKNYPDAILFFRMGDFYEMFDQDALIASKIMNIALTTRDKHSDDPVPMCGVPYHALETYLSRMIKQGMSVAICDQVEDPRLAKGIVKREVTRVITPGTVLDQGLLETHEHNYLAAVALQAAADSDRLSRAGLCFLELSTADFFVMEFEGEAVSDQLADELVRYKPKELLLSEAYVHNTTWRKTTRDLPFFKERAQPDWLFTDDHAFRTLCDHFGTVTLDGFGLSGRTLAIRSAAAIINYIKETQKRPLSHIAGLKIIETGSYLVLDRVCQRNLELTQRLTENTREGTLLALLDQTCTPMGARELKNWILRPLRDIVALEARQEAVANLITQQNSLSNVRQLLVNLCDLDRITARTALGIAHPKDLAALRDSLLLVPRIETILRTVARGRLNELLEKWETLSDLLELLETALEDNPPISLRDGGVVRKGYHQELDQLRALRNDTTSLIRAMEQEEKEASGIPSLKIKYNKVFGYFIEITRQHLDKVPAHFIRKQTLVNAERFYTAQLKEFEEKVLNAEEKIIELERELFENIRSRVAHEDFRLLSLSRILTEADILMSFAWLSLKNHYTRPHLVEDCVLHIERGVHPVMSLLSNVERFVPNDTHLEPDDVFFMIITGPNMSGKSTYIRQVALLTIMAQIGCFVPVKDMKLGLVDRIFTRVGAADYLLEGQSTFMVEMVETANILHNASARSLIILDEVGRGTSTFDGLALAWSIAEFICRNERLKARTLFATHYHQLTELSDFIEGVVNYHVAVKEWNDQIVFLYRLVEGGTDKSYGIQVARLAGVPNQVITRASEILTNLELTELNPAHLPFGVCSGSQQKHKSGQHDPAQITLFEQLITPSLHPVLEELSSLEISSLTPLQALNILSDLQRKLTENR